MWVACFTLFVSCSSKENSPEAQIRALIEQAQSATEKKDAGALRRLVSEKYSDSQGQDKKAIEAILRYYFLRNESIHLLTRVQEISFSQSDIAHTVVVVAMAGQPIPVAEQLERVRADLHRFEITWARENRQWRVIRAEWRRAEFSDFL